MSAGGPRVVARTELAAGEALVVVLVCFGLSIWTSVRYVLAGFSGGVATFGDDALLAIVAFEFVLGAAALLYLRARGVDLAGLYPHPTWRGAAVGVLLFGVAMACSLLVLSVAADPGVSQPYQQLVVDGRRSPGVVVPVSLFNGAFEEVFLLGALQRGLRGRGASAAIGTSLLVRVLYHLYQGPAGACAVLAGGAVFGLYYHRSGRVWPPAFAHGLWDIVAFSL